MTSIEKWTREEVIAWLVKIEMKEYLAVFQAYGVDGEMLIHMTEQDLETELGIKKTLHRKKLLRNINSEKDRSAPWLFSVTKIAGLSVMSFDYISSGMYPYEPNICTVFCSPVLVGHSLYIIGGQDPDKGLLNQTIEVTLDYRQRKAVSRVKRPLCVARSCAGACSMNQTAIFVTGGYAQAVEPFAAMNSCERYALATDVWTPIASLSEPKAQTALCTAGQRLFCFGGNNFYPESTFTSRIESLDLAHLDGPWIVLNLSDPDGLCLASFPFLPSFSFRVHYFS